MTTPEPDAAISVDGRWHCVVEERKDGERHFWNETVDAYNAVDAIDQALAGYDPDSVYSVEVERV